MIKGEECHFCCEGCAQVYEIAAENSMLQQVSAHPYSPPVLRDLIRKPASTAFFNIEGMWCPGCSLAAERVLANQPGVNAADVSFAAERGRIEYDPQLADPQKIISQLIPLGYRVRLSSTASGQKKQRLQERISLQLIAAIAFGMQVMMLYFVQLYPLYALGQFASLDVRKLQFLVWLLATPVIFFGGLSFLRGAWRALMAHTATMDTLVSLGVLSAYGYSVYITLVGGGETYFDSVAMITVFIMFGRYLETIGGAQARKDLHTLLRLQPEFAWLADESQWRQVHAEDLNPDDCIRVREGERVPADGEVYRGEGTADESMLTGESRTVQKAAGEALFAGTVLVSGAVEIKVTTKLENSRLAQISELVAETLSKKPPIQRLADRVSTYFASAILAIAVLTFAGWFLIGHSFNRAVLAGVAVLVVACPCALGLATPLALSISLSKAARKGVLVRNPAVIETFAKIDRMVFDKTGTLTRGELKLVTVEPVAQFSGSAQSLLQLAASVEQFSSHPLAKAIMKANGADLVTAEGFVSVQGAGASAILQLESPQIVKIGSCRLGQVDSSSNIWNAAEDHASNGETIVWVWIGGQLAGFLAFQDEADFAIPAVLERLREDKIELSILSGDSPAATRVLAQLLGIISFEGGYLPEQKALQIHDWQESGERVAMVGDGINDAPALAQADVSITVAGGSDVAGATSDLVLIRSELTLIPWFLELSRGTRRVILENLAWAFAYNLLAVPLAILGVISPVIAAAAMAVSSLLVVFNSLRLKRETV